MPPDNSSSPDDKPDLDATIGSDPTSPSEQLEPKVTGTPPPLSEQTPAGSSKPIVGKGGRKGKGWLIALLILLIAAGAAAAYFALHKTKSNPTATVATKKDVALINYGVPNDGAVPQYPTNIIGSVTSVEINAQLFEGLVGYENLTKLSPLLATSWYNPDDSTWIFTLRQGVKFHSGRTMTADDVKYTLDYAVAHQNDNDGGSVLSIASTIKQVDVMGANKVKITTDGPDPVLLNRLTYLGIIDSKAKLGDVNAGTGPYMVKSGTTPTDTSIDLAAVGSYWGGHVYTREVKINLYDDLDQLAKDAKDRKVDLSGDFTLTQLKDINPTKTISVPDEGVNFIGFNTEKAGSPLKTLATRQAVADALNMPAIAKAAGLKVDFANQLVPLLIPGHNPAIKDNKYDQAKAKQLLATVPNAATTTLTFAYPSRDMALATEIINELKAVGLNIQGKPVDDFNTLIDNVLAGDYDIYTYGYSSSTQDGLDILGSILEGNNDYSNSQIDDLIQQAGNTLDQAKRLQAMQKVATIVSDEKPVIPLYTVDRQYALTKPYTVKPDIPGMVTGVYFWKVYQN